MVGLGSGMRYVSNHIGLVERITLIAIYKRQIKEICLRKMDHYIGEFSIFMRKNHFFAWLQNICFVMHPAGVSLFLDIMIKCYQVIPCCSLAAIK